MASSAYLSNGMCGLFRDIHASNAWCRNRFARSGLMTPPCGVPAVRGTTLPSSICVQPVHSRLDQLAQPLLQDAVASNPEKDRSLCHPLGAPQVQAVASEDQGGTRLV